MICHVVPVAYSSSLDIDIHGITCAHNIYRSCIVTMTCRATLGLSNAIGAFLCCGGMCLLQPQVTLGDVG